MGSFENIFLSIKKTMFKILKGGQDISWRILKIDTGHTGILELKSPFYKTPKLWAAASTQLLWSGVLWFKSFLVMQSKDGNIKIADGERWHTVISYRS